MGVYETSLLLYQLFLIPVIFFSMLFLNLAVTNIIAKRPARRFKRKIDNWPAVTVQIPTYNDAVAVRCLKHCLKFDYPKDKFDVIVADDSTDSKTKAVIDDFVKKHPDRIRVVRRSNRRGFKPGALNNSLKYTKGDIIVVFDSDFTPKKDFLRKIVAPMLEDEKIGIVQSRMGYINMNQNMITKMASILLMIYYQIVVPISNNLGTIFFCGHSGAIRKNLLLKVGGWNEKSLTEDTELSLRMLKAGYKTLYLPNVVSRGEVPFTLISFLKQQMRWSYGNTKVFIDNALSIWTHKMFSFPQKMMITYKTLGNVVALFVIWMTLFAVVSMLTGPTTEFSITDVKRFFAIYFSTGGFMLLALVSLHKENKLKLMKSFIIGAPTVGLVLAFTNAIAFIQALFGMKMTWFRTPKYGSISVLNWFMKRFKGR